MLNGNTEIKLEWVTAKLPDVQAYCRVMEERNFEVLSVACGDSLNGWAFLLTLRVPKMLYVNYETNTSPDAEWIGEQCQLGPFPGHAEAEEAERRTIMMLGLDKVRDSYVTGQREHMRTFIASKHA